MNTQPGAKPKKAPTPRKKPAPIFITKSEIAALLSVGDIQTIDSWIAKGRFPPPHSQPGDRHTVWLRRDWNVYVETGSWPAHVWPKRG